MLFSSLCNRHWFTYEMQYKHENTYKLFIKISQDMYQNCQPVLSMWRRGVISVAVICMESRTVMSSSNSRQAYCICLCTITFGKAWIHLFSHLPTMQHRLDSLALVGNQTKRRITLNSKATGCEASNSIHKKTDLLQKLQQSHLMWQGGGHIFQ